MPKKLDPYEKFIKSNPEPWEKELSDATERGEFKPVPNSDEMLVKIRQAAKEYMASKTVCVRLDQTDLKTVREKASKAGLPYQTLIKAVVHQFATGKITLVI